MYSSYHLSILSDLTLGAILIFLWLARRNDRHALCWGAGHMLLGLTVLFWNLAPKSDIFQILSAICSVLTTASLVAGAQYFCGKRPFWWRNIALWGVLLLPSAATLGAPFPFFEYADAVSFSLALAFIWCAWRLLGRRTLTYRLLALLLALRALNLLVNAAIGLAHTDLQLFFVTAFILKVGSAFALIYAVVHENEESFLRILNGLGHGFLIRDSNGIIRFTSQKLLDHLGASHATQIIGQHVSSITPARYDGEVADWYRRVTTPGTQLPCIDERFYKRSDGTEFPADVLSVPYEERGHVFVISQVIDITERKAQEAERQRAAMLDEQTGLFNRSALRQLLGAILSCNTEDGQTTLLLLIDIDHFKRINDTLGHSIGDKLLKLVAERLKSLQASHDVLARFGGDEFALVVSEQAPSTAQENAESLARVILLALSKPFELDNFRITLKASVGIALGPEQGIDPESLLSAADAALYAAKDAGRNRFLVFNNEMVASSRNALMIDEALQNAITNKEFKLVYQPIVSARSRRLCKVEALLRWTTPSLGFVPPDRFIPIAEESGQIVEIGTWVLQEAARQARIWADQCEEPIRIAVNVSAAQLVDPDFLHIVNEAIKDSGATPAEIEIEMTERVLINEADSVVRVIEALHAKGLSTSLDDFGTGYSSLSYLTRFHLRTLKIDRAFVNGIEHDGRNLALVRAIIAMGHSLGMEIVAEGVETEAQAAILTELGCEYLQGYLFSRPVPAAELPGLERRPPLGTQAGSDTGK